MPITIEKAGGILEKVFRGQPVGQYVYIGIGTAAVAPNKYGSYSEISGDANYSRLPVALTGDNAGGWNAFAKIGSGTTYAITTKDTLTFSGQYGANTSWSTTDTSTYAKYVLVFSSQTQQTKDLLCWGYLYEAGVRISTGNVTAGRSFIIPAGSLEVHLCDDNDI